MDPIFTVMLDVARLATGGSDAARMEAQRIARERELRATDSITADEPAFDTAHATKRESVRLRRWFGFPTARSNLRSS